MSNVRNVLLTGAAIGLLSSGASGMVAWSNASGSTSLLEWENGQSQNGLFGDPTVSGDTFFFLANNNFTAISAGGGSVTVTDTLSVDVHALGLNEFTEVLFYSAGDYNLLGPDATVDVTGNLDVENLDNGDVFSDAFTVIDPIPFPFGDAVGQWEGFSLVDLSGESGGPFTSLHIEFTNSVIAISGVSGSSSIALGTLPVTQASFALRIIPAPGSAVALIGGVALVARRRRR